MALAITGESFRVYLPALLERAQAGPEPSAPLSAPSLHATCTRLSATHAHFEAERAPTHGELHQLKLAFGRRRELLLEGHIVRSIHTSAPALLCGRFDRSLGALFEIEFAPTSPDLFALADVVQASRNERRMRARRVARRAGIALAPMRASMHRA